MRRRPLVARRDAVDSTDKRAKHKEEIQLKLMMIKL